MAVGQDKWYHFGAGAPLILAYLIGDWDVHCGYGLLTHGHILLVKGSNMSVVWHCAKSRFVPKGTGKEACHVSCVQPSSAVGGQASCNEHQITLD